jgi:hypothetical protein
MRPENRSRHLSEVAPVHSCRECRTNDAANARTSNHRWFNPNLLQYFNHSDVREAANGASTKRNADTLCLD